MSVVIDYLPLGFFIVALASLWVRLVRGGRGRRS